MNIIKENKKKYKIDSYKYLNSLKIIINIIIDFVVKTRSLFKY